MDKKQIKEYLSEFARYCKQPGIDEASLLETALFLEGMFGFLLTDDEICKEILGDHPAIEKIVLEKLEVV
jgi:hypothetical protein